VLSPLEAPEAGGLFQQLAPLLGLRGEDLLDAPLADDRVHPAAEAEVGKQLDEVDAANGGLVQQVLALAAAVEPARDRKLRIRQRPVAVRIVEQELDLAELLRRTTAASGKEHVVRFLGTELGRRERSGRPDDRVRDVGLAGSVRPDDDGDARLQPHLDRIGERLEAAQLDSA
jgi:hypothetical protein